MTIYPWLTLRNRTYYLRAPVPADIRKSLGKNKILKSFGIQDSREAVEKLHIQSAVVTETFENERGSKDASQPPLEELTDPQIKIISDVHFTHLLDNNE